MHPRDSIPVGRRSRRRRGAVMVITLLALVLLAALLFYVMNLGRQVGTRTETQNAADATAAAGAGWVARTLNSVAMNNTGIARSIALVQVLDSMPMATRYAHADQVAVRDAVDAQLRRGVDGSWVRDGLTRFRDEVAAEVDELAPMASFFNDSGYDVRRVTHFDGPGGMGDLWRAMLAMDAHSTAAMESLAALAELSASRGGEAHLQGAEATAVLVPADDPVPWRRGGFNEFERPVRYGLLPETSDDRVVRRGPYDAVFGWRDPIGDWEGRWAGRHRNAGGGAPGVPIGRGAGGDTWINEGVRAERYRVYGPFTHMLRQLGAHARVHLPHSRFSDYPYAPPNSYWVNRLARMKLGYLWPGGAVGRVVEPDWRVGFIDAVGLAESDPSQIRETAFVAVEIKSRYPLGHPRFLSAGSWAYVEEDQPRRRSPRIIWAAGWVDPRRWVIDSGGAIEQVASYVWRDRWSYSVYFDTDIGIPPEVDEDGRPVTTPVYRIDDYVFVGVNVGPEVEVRNPNNFGDRGELPGPVDLDHGVIGHDEASRRRFLTFLGVARRDNGAMMWSDGFDRGRPYPNHVAVAQATVFNNHSFDLWTGMWYAQGERVDEYAGWAERLDAARDVVAGASGTDPAELADLIEQMRAVEPLAPIMLSH